MSNLNQVQGLIAAGDKDSALAVLASMLVKDPKQLEAWLMLGDLVDDPSHRKDCYRWALRLSPENAHALAKLRELEEPPAGDLQTADSKVGDTDKKSPVEEEKPTLKNIPKPIVTSAASRSKGLGIIAYVLGGLGAFLLLLYVIANPDEFSNGVNVLYVGLIFIGLIAATIMLSASNKNRS